ncbi:MAG TPA: PAS domain S-box protein [Candidatus Dormibacteraeota bacterium]|jgi:PAS domain S-box-containing protein
MASSASVARAYDLAETAVTAAFAPEAGRVQARLAAIVQSSGDAMCSMTLDRVIDTWNLGAERLLGYAAWEVVGRPADMLVPVELRPELDAMLARLRAGRRAASFDTWRRRRDGSLVEVAIALSAMRSPSGRPAGYAAVLHDLTDRRRAETELAAARAASEVLAARDRMARRLHDGAIQAIFAAGMRLQATASMSRDPVLQDRLQHVIEQLDVVIADLRRQVYGLGGDDPERTPAAR